MEALKEQEETCCYGSKKKAVRSECHQNKQGPESGVRFILSSNLLECWTLTTKTVAQFQSRLRSTFCSFIRRLGVGEWGGEGKEAGGLFLSPAASVWLRDTRGMEDFLGRSQFSTQTPSQSEAVVLDVAPSGLIDSCWCCGSNSEQLNSSAAEGEAV